MFSARSNLTSRDIEGHKQLLEREPVSIVLLTSRTAGDENPGPGNPKAPKTHKAIPLAGALRSAAVPESIISNYGFTDEELSTNYQGMFQDAVQRLFQTVELEWTGSDVELPLAGAENEENKSECKSQHRHSQTPRTTKTTKCKAEQGAWADRHTIEAQWSFSVRATTRFRLAFNQKQTTWSPPRARR